MSIIFFSLVDVLELSEVSCCRLPPGSPQIFPHLPPSDSRLSGDLPAPDFLPFEGYQQDFDEFDDEEHMDYEPDVLMHDHQGVPKLNCNSHRT